MFPKSWRQGQTPNKNWQGGFLRPNQYWLPERRKTLLTTLQWMKTTGTFVSRSKHIQQVIIAFTDTVKMQKFWKTVIRERWLYLLWLRMRPWWGWRRWGRAAWRPKRMRSGWTRPACWSGAPERLAAESPKNCSLEKMFSVSFWNFNFY